ncbi:TIR domain-containing protein [Methylobacter tundripaludum]|uniref:TIR domain-containing protein n=1 Tax=Methylobacter tundripaludum TaxID=173365 RepID=A0A2S6H8V8_9GAMM|nr:TIR domain-containing protein [Methylobacter tundripaludum]PPK73907.1 TIR domain-containing protein [Methylobacter tundripaludum]
MTNESQQTRRFLVALSYPRENIQFVRKVADRLAIKLGRNRVFFDKWYEDELLGKNGDLKLRRIYSENSELVVPFFSKYYRKHWCRLEWDVMRNMLIECKNDDRVVPVSLDNTKIEGWQTIDFCIERGRRTANQVADIILEKCQNLGLLVNDDLCVDNKSDQTRINVKTVVPEICVNKVPKNPRIKYYALPQCGPVFVGRKKELSDFDNAWMDNGIAIVTLVAPAGVGKTALIKEWLNRLKSEGWRGAKEVYIWSSFREGSSEDKGLEDIFFEETLEWFRVSCDKSINISEKGRLLADAVIGNRTLFVLHGLEALQYPPGQRLGLLRAPGIQSFLEQLAFIKDNSGLCVVTSCEIIAELDEYQRSDNKPNGSALQINLQNLDPVNGAQLLYQLGATKVGTTPISFNDDELMAASREVQGHALTLSLLARYLKKAENGDILCRDKINFTVADDAVNNGYALKVVAAYEKWFMSDGGSSASNGLELDILRLFGLFDYPASKASLSVLRAEPVIKGLTDRIAGRKDREWNIATTNLIDTGLLWYTEDQRLDTHRIVKEYFANQLRQPKYKGRAWEEGHKRLYLYFSKLGPYLPDNLLGLDPLYQAVAHACNAGEYEEAYEAIYLKRILRGKTCYSTKNLGAISSDLRAVGYFFKNKWNEIVSGLPIKNIQGWLFNEAAFSLRALGRTDEALEPFRIAYKIFLDLKRWRDAAAVANNLSEIMLVMGQLEGKFDSAEEMGAIDYAEEAVKHARKTRNQSDLHPRLIMRAYVCHQLGEFGKANSQFRQIDLYLNKHQNVRLHPVESYLYWDYQLAIPELLAWRHFMASSGNIEGELVGNEEEVKWIQHCQLIRNQASQIINRDNQNLNLLSTALIKLIECRASLYCVLLNHVNPNKNEILNSTSLDLSEAVKGLKHAAQQDEIPRGLLPYAWVSWIKGDKTESNRALEEAFRIADRGSMKLHIADVLLFRARLFRNEADLRAAESHIEECEYGLRKHELMDAKEIILEGRKLAPAFEELLVGYFPPLNYARYTFPQTLN